MSLGEGEGVFKVNEIIGCSLEYMECPICMERYSRNPRYFLGGFLWGGWEGEVELVA